MQCRLNFMVWLWLACGGALLVFQITIGTSLLQFGEPQVEGPKLVFGGDKQTKTRHDDTKRGTLNCPVCQEPIQECPKCQSCQIDFPAIRIFLEEHVTQQRNHPLIIAKTRGITRVPGFYMSLHPPDKDQFASKVILSTGHWEGQKVSKLLLYMADAPNDYYFVDVGAHIGFLALSMVASGHRTIAMEPLAHNYGLLRESILLNGIDDKEDQSMIETFNIALGNETSSYCMSVGTGNQAFAKIDAGTFNMECDATRHKVEMKRLDDVIPDKKIWLLNIDVQFDGPLIIYGAKKILAGENPPKYIHFIVSRDVGVDLKVFLSWLQQFGYKMTDSRVGALSNIDIYVDTAVGGQPNYIMAQHFKNL